MRIRRRFSPAVLLGLLAILTASACSEKEKEPGTYSIRDLNRQMLEELQGDWTTTNARGEVQLVRFEEDRILWSFGAEDEYECPYRPMSYSRNALKIDLRLLCKRRTGSDQWIAHRLLFSSAMTEFTMAHGENRDIVDGVFVRASE